MSSSDLWVVGLYVAGSFFAIGVLLLFLASFLLGVVDFMRRMIG